MTVDQRVARQQLRKKYRKVPFKRHSACRVCGTRLPKPVIDLPAFPLTEIYVAERISEKLAVVDQAFCLCDTCGHGQLRNAIDPAALYGDSYFTRTTDSGSAKTAIDVFLEFVEPLLPKGRLKGILEIGCNDLYMLSKLQDRADFAVGVDPIWKGKEQDASSGKIRVLGEFVEDVDFKSPDLNYDVVISSHTLEHIDDPVSLLRRLVDAAPANTRFFFQFPGLEPLVHDGRFDQLHQQHYNYFSLRSVRHALKLAGAELVDFKYNYDHWGALMIAFQKRSSAAFGPSRKLPPAPSRVTAADVRDRFKLFRQMMSGINAQLGYLRRQKKMYGFGAALMLPLLNYYLPELSKLECIIDDDPNKKGLYYINFPVQIVPASAVADLRDSTVVITAINSKQIVRALTKKMIDLQVRDIFIPTTTI